MSIKDTSMPAMSSSRHSNAAASVDQVQTAGAVKLGIEQPTGPSGAPRFDSSIPAAPTLSLPKGGGAIRGIGEKTDINLCTGSSSASIPIRTSPSRSDIHPQLAISYSSGAGNGPFGLGWTLSLPQISRKTSKGLPRYIDNPSDIESDVFLFAGQEDLVPVFQRNIKDEVILDGQGRPIIAQTLKGDYSVHRYAPRIEKSFDRIERWTNMKDLDDIHWRVISGQNVTSIFGKDAESRVCSPDDATKSSRQIFSWLISEMYDSKGNAMLYRYQAEDSVNVSILQANEMNRSISSRQVNRYIRRILYGNTNPNRDLDSWTPFSASNLPQTTWKFSVVFDYGEYDIENPQISDKGNWPCRKDPFSTYHAGFEIRTYRLCHRILMFHHFTELGKGDYLIASTNFIYEQNNHMTYLSAALQAGYVWDQTGAKYVRQTLPEVEFQYSRFPSDSELAQLVVQDVESEDLENLPEGVDESLYQWVDLDGEGMSGILTDQGGNWFYKRNISANNTGGASQSSPEAGSAHARFEHLEEARLRPNLSTTGGSAHFGDVSGEGKLDLIQMEHGSWGFYERTLDDGWLSFHAFSEFPNIDASARGAKFVDLTGDGLADLLVCKDQTFIWYPSAGIKGYGMPQATTQANSEQSGPICLQADTEQSVFLADMSGDGLSDVVRVRYSDVCYWPNLGYGNFGPAVYMDNSPCFDSVERFNEKFVRFADLDGSGTTDILYFGVEGVDIYLNQSGNSFADRKRLNVLPPVDNTTNLTVVDILGNGTNCIAWSSPLPSVTGSRLRYLDIMQGCKPHLLTSVNNNLGVERRFHYAPSTKFYLQDKQAGQPWITKLRFPVQCVEKAEVFDKISGSRFTSIYSYHHGFYDGFEREFNGFARVDQLETDHIGMGHLNPDGEALTLLEVPHLYKKTWFHTGGFIDNQLFSSRLATEYFSAASTISSPLGDTILPLNLDDGQQREACRALKGKALRSEVYDSGTRNSDKAPYRTEESNFTLVPLQKVQDTHGHCVFTTHARESVTVDFERNSNDPRVLHSLVLDADIFGNIRKSLQVAYGRQPGITPLTGLDKRKQESTLLTYSEFDFTNILDGEHYRLPVTCESRQYEVTGLRPRTPGRFLFDDLAADSALPIVSIIDIPFETSPSPTIPQKRLIKKSRILYRRDDLNGFLPKREIQSLGLPGVAYEMAFTPGILNGIYQRKQVGGALENLIPDPNLVMSEAGYVDLDSDNHWWKPSNRVFFSPDPSDLAPQELSSARFSFFSLQRTVNPFKSSTSIVYDDYFMFPVRVQDSVGNSRSSIMDYRSLQPTVVTDENDNRTGAAFDAMGLVSGTAIMGKASENLGDNLESFRSTLPQDNLDQFFASPSTDLAITLLGNATTRIIYDYGRFQSSQEPAYTCIISRESHVSDAPPTGNLRVQVTFSYSNGLGKSIQRKNLAEAGPIIDGGPVVSSRWIGKDWTVYNSKGKPIKIYESFFDTIHRFNQDTGSRVASMLLYDPMMRPVAKLEPNHAFSKAVINNAWTQSAFDSSDNILVSNPRNDLDVGKLFEGLPQEAYLPSWYDARINGAQGSDEKSAAVKTALHANTPQKQHLDPLGRPILTVDDNGNGEMFANRASLDIRGSQLEIVDAAGKASIRYDYNVCGDSIHETSCDSGEVWALHDVLGKAVSTWDSRLIRLRSVYDAIRRPIEMWVSENGSPDILVEQSVYGEQNPNSYLDNTRGKEWQVKDQAGLVTNKFDFKGNPTLIIRRLCREYKGTIDVSAESFSLTTEHAKSTTYDALNRPIQIIAADLSITNNVYNQTGLLDKVFLNIRGENTSTDATTWTPLVTKTEYNARDQVTQMVHGNGIISTSSFDELTSRLQRLQRRRGSSSIQDLNYVYDTLGNISAIQDKAQQTIFFRNSRIDSSTEYTYDPTGRLISATGREHLGQTGGNAPGPFDVPSINGDSPTDGAAMGRYTEKYTYDLVGNILLLVHAGNDARNPGWTLSYNYQETSSIEAGKKSNRLSSTSIGSVTSNYKYDAHGNMIYMPHLPAMSWDFKNQLRSSSKQIVSGSNVPETTYYIYNSKGERIRKITESQAGSGSTATPVRIKERLYLADFEIFQTFGDGGELISLERTTLQVNHEETCIANVELRTQGTDDGIERIIRYQYANNIGSCGVELDETGRLISYEEFYPFGSSSYQAVASNVGVPKRYRYSGKERDSENGLYYYGARYYASWLSRWTSPDPSGEGNLLYVFVRNNPVRFIDPDGREESDGGKWREVEYRNGMGTLAHEILGPEIARRVNQLKNPNLKGYAEHPTLPGGSKTPGSTLPGKIDVLIASYLGAGNVAAHVYELRYRTGYENVLKKQSETVHYAQFLPDVLDGNKVATKGPGTILTTEIAAQKVVLRPIIFSQGRYEFKIEFWLAKKPAALGGGVEPGVILYKISARINKEAEEQEQIQQMERTLQLMRTDLRSTVESQAIHGQRMAAGTGLAVGGVAGAVGTVVIIGGALIGELLIPAAALTVEAEVVSAGAMATVHVLRPIVAPVVVKAAEEISIAAGFTLFFKKFFGGGDSN